MKTSNERVKIPKKKVKRILGMTTLQITVLMILSCCLFSVVMSFVGMVLYNSQLLTNFQKLTPTFYPTINQPTTPPFLTPSPISYTSTSTLTLQPTETATLTSPFTPTMTSTSTSTPSLTPTLSRAELNIKYPVVDPLDLYSHPDEYKGKRFRITGIIVAMEQLENSDEWIIQIGPDMNVPSGQIISRHPVGIKNFLYDANLKLNLQITVYGLGDGYITGSLGVAPIIIMEFYYY